MLKKTLKIIGIFLLVLILALVAAPFLFKDKIKELVTQTINENLDATVAFSEVEMSLFSNFPNATVSVEKLSVINKAPFLGDTLFYAEDLELKMSIKELFKGEKEAKNIEGIKLKNTIANIIFNKDGVGNFDIALKKQENKEESKSDNQPFAIKLQNYAAENFKITYFDETSQMKMVLDSIYHQGKGDFSKNILDLDTKTTAKLSFAMANANYMNNVAISLEAVLGLDLDKSKYTFKENKAIINQLSLEFDGFLQMVEDGQIYDLKFNTPTSSFKNFLGLLPAQYAGNLNQVKTEGECTISGVVKGSLTETSIPAFNIEIASNNASFQYANLPKAVKNIVIDTHIVNETGQLKDTYVNIDNLAFSIDKDVFVANATIKNITENPIIAANLKGTINLANLSKAYPIALEKALTGILNADVQTNFDMLSVEKNNYQNIRNAGAISLSNFNYDGPEMAKPFQIAKTTLLFNPNQIKLTEFDAKTGKSDLQIAGSLDNFYGFLFQNQVLKGNFTLQSNYLAVADFMTTSSTTTTNDKNKTATETLKIPSFLDCSLTAKANTVVYDNLTLKEVSGNLTIRDEAVSLKDLKMNVFGGQIGMTGNVSTKKTTPSFAMDLDLSKLNIAEAFTQMDMLKKIAPIADVIEGKLNSTIHLSGDLNPDMTPDLKTISGDLLGQLLASSINEDKSKLLTSLASNVKFIDLKKINLNDVKAALSFKDGKVNIKPFDIKYNDIKVTIGGTHGFDQTMNYNLNFDVPAKYLGTEVNGLLAKLSPAEVNKLQNIPVNAVLGGSFASPTVKTDLKQATTNLATQLVKQQKDKLLDKGLGQLGGLLGNKTPTDTTKNLVPKTKEEVKTEVKNQVKDKAKDILGGFLGGKKKEK